MYIIFLLLILFLFIILYTHMENLIKKGTCKCVDYFKKGKGLYIKQKNQKKVYKI